MTSSPPPPPRLYYHHPVSVTTSLTSLILIPSTFAFQRIHLVSTLVVKEKKNVCVTVGNLVSNKDDAKLVFSAFLTDPNLFDRN